MKKTLVFSLCFLIFCFCKKKEVAEPSPDPEPQATTSPPDTVKPGNYFPVWPGSYWTYVDHTGKIFTDSASKTWILHKYCNYGNPCSETKPAFVPFYNKQPVYGYRMLDLSPAPFGNYFIPYYFVSETVGQSFAFPIFCDTRMGNPCIRENIKIASKTKDVNGDSMIVVTGFYHANSLDKEWMNGDSNVITVRHYRKNVGLTLSYRYDTLSHDTTYKLRLLSHFIAPH